ncbi:hypothetical protein FJ656_20735, partial [Schumannella luteola]
MSRTTPHTPWARVAAIGVGLAVLVGVLVTAFSWPSLTSEVQDIPVAIVGPDAAVTALETALDEKVPGAFDFSTVDDRDAAVSAIETREVYGAIVVGQTPEVLVASAASPAVSQV